MPPDLGGSKGYAPQPGEFNAGPVLLLLALRHKCRLLRFHPRANTSVSLPLSVPIVPVLEPRIGTRIDGRAGPFEPSLPTPIHRSRWEIRPCSSPAPCTRERAH